MKVVRAAISLFILVVIGLAVAGWIWTGGHQAASAAAASRIVLSVAIITGLVGLRSLWRHPEGSRT
jgi:hypothetical protein